MKLLEHEAKTLLLESHIPIPRSELIGRTDQPTLAFPLVLKSQVPIGARGKAGGIKFVDKPEQYEQRKQDLFELEIGGYKPSILLAEEKLSIARELYLNLMVDRTSQSLQLMAHENGGVEVEDQSGFRTWPVPYESADIDSLGQALADYFNLPGQTFALQELVQNLKTCLVDNDALMIEINPLVLTSDNRLVAGDAKMTVDDAAAFRHEWNFEDTPAEANFVTIDPQGNIATIANGAGLAMATVDAAYGAGLRPANFLDIGGGANTETLLTAFKRIVEYENIRGIVINIFAGITRADEVARAIVAAREQIAHLPPLFIRLAGTSYDEAAKILHDNHIVIMPSLDACLAAAKEKIHE